MPEPYLNNKQITLSYSNSHGECYYFQKAIKEGQAYVNIEPNGDASVVRYIKNERIENDVAPIFEVLKQFYHLI